MLFSLPAQGLIFRFKFLMLITLACAAMTVIFFIVSQVSDPQTSREKVPRGSCTHTEITEGLCSRQLVNLCTTLSGQPGGSSC